MQGLRVPKFAAEVGPATRVWLIAGSRGRFWSGRAVGVTLVWQRPWAPNQRSSSTRRDDEATPQMKIEIRRVGSSEIGAEEEAKDDAAAAAL